MRIFGFEIGRSTKTKELVVAADHPIKKEARRPASAEIGDSGTDIYVGIVQEEYRANLLNEQGVKVFDRMRRSDATVRAAILVTQLPIRRTEWFIKDASEEKIDQEIGEFVRKNLFEWMTITWDDLLRQALLMLPFGVMVFEKVYALKEFEGKTYVIWKKLAPRLPKTIMSWQLPNGKDGIQQLRRDGKTADIPIEKLCIFVNEKEGENWWGISILRSAYQHWFIKNYIYTIDSMAFERQGLGVPYVKLPDGYTDADEAKAKKILQNMRANEKAYVVIPPDHEIGFMDMGGKQLRDPKNSIAHHDRQITKAVLAQFLELGATSSGSRALSDDQSDLFLKSLEAIANAIKDVFNKYAIPQLVNFNYNEVQNYPKLDYSGIIKSDVEKLATAYKTLSEAGAIQQHPDDEQHFRGLLGLPEVTEEERERREEEGEEEAEKEKAERTTKDLGLEEELEDEKKKKPRNSHEIAVKIKNRIGNMGTSDAIRFLRHHINNIETAAEHNDFYKEIKGSLAVRLREYELKIFKEHNDFVSWRPLTLAEHKVNFKGIHDELEKLERDFKKESVDLLEKEKDRYIKQVSEAILKEDAKGIKDAKFLVKGDYEKIVKKHITQAYQFGLANAAREMGEDTPRRPADSLRQIDITASTVVDDHLMRFTTKAKTAIVEAIRKPDDKKEFQENKARAIGALGSVLSQTIRNTVVDTAAIVMAGFLNNGRNDVFTIFEDKIFALQRSEILDSQTCNYCLSVDARIMEKDDPFASNTIFHSHCRGIWVEILEDEEDKPRIDGIPNTLRDRFGSSVNELIQPKNPIVKKSSLAKKLIDRKEKK